MFKIFLLLYNRMVWYNNKNILNKYEFSSFSEGKDREYLYQDPNQILIRNYISKYTPYDSVLLYHDLGTGKTCSSITIAEGFKEYIQNIDRKVIVLVKNKNIQRNFINELLSLCTGDEYVTEKKREEYFKGNNENIRNRLHRLINKTYNFITYGTFTNSVLGIKDKRTKKRIYYSGLQNLNNAVIIVDEAHNITNNDAYIALHKILSNSYNYRLILLTATPMYDNPREMFELSNLLNANNKEMTLPIRNDLFKDGLLSKGDSDNITNSIIKGGIINITESGKRLLERTLQGKVSYLKANTKTNAKKIEVGDDLIGGKEGTTKVVGCEMTKGQFLVYLDGLKNDIKTDIRYNIADVVHNIESGENLGGVDNSGTNGLYKNSNDASTMTYPGNKYGQEGFTEIFDKRGESWSIKDKYKKVITTDLYKYSTKLARLLKNIKNDSGNVFIYSNYVSYGGTSLIKQILLNNGFKEWNGKDSEEFNNFIMYDQSNSVERRERLRRIFNSKDNKHGKKIRIIVGSPIISEGITLKNVRSVHIVEPSWNMSRINQIIGRSIRNNSHNDLEESERNVKVYKYITIYKHDIDNIKRWNDKQKRFYQFFIDREKYILSEEKDRSNKQIERLLKEISFDCEFFKNRNMITEFKDNSPECDYTKCQYKCKMPKDKSKVVDKWSYIMNLDFFDKFDIEWVNNFIKGLFIKYFIWKLSDIEKIIQQIEPNISKESIYFALNNFVNNKTPLLDMYDRDGFIVRKGDFYIFNGYDIDIDSSLYKKFFDFSVKENKYTLDKYANEYLNINLKNTKKEKKKIKTEKLSETDIAYNNKLLRKHKILGTYRQKGLGELYGKKDGVFRLVLQKQLENDDDKRKVVTGMVIKSIKKDNLLDIIQQLKLKSTTPFEEFSNSELSKKIENHLKQTNRILH